MGRRSNQQTELVFGRHGGRRRGAGRKPNGEKPLIAHRPRTALNGREPVLVTLKVLPHVWNLRTRRAFARVLDALIRARQQRSARVTHYSVQSDHAHLLVEANTARHLSRGIQGLAVRIARRLNRMMGRSGKVFADRFHDRVLTTPRQVRHALTYVLCNARKHGRAPARRRWLDPFSSAELFDGWIGGAVLRQPDLADASVTQPRTWLLRVGWRRAGGPLDPDHRPGTRADSIRH